MKVPFNDLYSQHQSLLSQFMKSLEQGIRESAFILGSDVQEFENKFAVQNALLGHYIVPAIEHGLSLASHVANAYEEHADQFPASQLDPSMKRDFRHLIQDHDGAWLYALAAVFAQVMGNGMPTQQHRGSVAQSHLDDLLARKHLFESG